VSWHALATGDGTEDHGGQEVAGSPCWRVHPEQRGSFTGRPVGRRQSGIADGLNSLPANDDPTQGIDFQFDVIAIQTGHFDDDVLANHDRLARLPRENESHRTCGMCRYPTDRLRHRSTIGMRWGGVRWRGYRFALPKTARGERRALLPPGEVEAVQIHQRPAWSVPLGISI